MGLDMYFYRNSVSSENQIYYFRKHADFHGFLMKIWCSLNPEKDSDDFNCDVLEITEEILEQIEKECKNKEHIHYHGFFWGNSYDEDWEMTEKELIPIIRKEFENGNKVYYTPWW